tara:strand:- start:231 stop:665 length:435 start_codon:yes stop_codon:yes gene_type:complete
MLTGVEILLERMKTNPEEFIEGGYSKWSRVINNAWDILTEQERKALEDGTKEAKRDHFNGEVMRVLSQGHDDRVITDMEERIYEATKGKRLMQGSFSTTSAIITPQSMIEQVKDTLDKQFEEAYARKDTKTMRATTKLKNAMRK